MMSCGEFEWVTYLRRMLVGLDVVVVDTGFGGGVDGRNQHQSRRIVLFREREKKKRKRKYVTEEAARRWQGKSWELSWG